MFHPKHIVVLVALVSTVTSSSSDHVARFRNYTAILRGMPAMKHHSRSMQTTKAVLYRHNLFLKRPNTNEGRVDFSDIRKRRESMTSASTKVTFVPGLTNQVTLVPRSTTTTHPYVVLSTGQQVRFQNSSGSDFPQRISEKPLVTTMGGNHQQNISRSEWIKMSGSNPQGTFKFETTTSNRNKSESSSTTTYGSENHRSKSESITSGYIRSQSTFVSLETTASGISNTQSSIASTKTYIVMTTSKSSHVATDLPYVAVGEETVSNQTIPCPRMCVCKQMSAWEKYIREYMKLLDQTITERYSWQQIGEMVARQRWKHNPEARIRAWESLLYKDITCHVGEHQELSVDLDFREVVISTDVGSLNLTFICLNGGEILVKNLDVFLESGFISIVNCSVRTDGYLISNLSRVKMVTITINNSALKWLRNITIANTNRLTVLRIYRTPLDGYPRIANQTKGRLKSVYFKHNNMTDTNCSFSMGSKNLTLVSITDNDLRHIPTCVLTPVVITLILSNNKLENISALLYPRFSPATNLSYLWLDHNSIEDVGMFTYMKLTLLDLSYNKIQHLNKLTFNRLPELTYLDLSWNMVKAVPPGTFKAFFFLKFLNLSHNQIRDFSYLQSPMSASDINIHHNQLVYPPFYQDGYHILTAHTINAGNNPYHCDCAAETFKNHILYSKVISKNRVHFKHLDNYTCFSPQSLRNRTLLSLNFSTVCPIVTECPESCECWFNKTTNVTEVRCGGVHMTSLPAAVPEGAVILLFNGNGIGQVPTREYFTRAEYLNLSRNALDKLDESVCELWYHLNSVDISNNEIRYLPKCFENFNLSAMTLHLYGNPWICDCNTLWMITWLKQNKQYIPGYSKITCQDEDLKEIQLDSFVTSELNCDSNSYLKVAIPLGFLAMLALVLIPLAYKFRFQTQVFIHAQFHARPFDRRKVNDAEYMYDIFLSYASQNEAWVVHTLMPRLETRDRPYRVCVHYKDFEVGAAVVDNIVAAVQKSRCTVVILSKDYIASEWCTFEFQKAHHEVIKDGTHKLAVILMEDVPVEDLFPELKVYLKRNTYLRLDDRWFWQKLFYCLPDPSIDKQKQNQKDENQFEMVDL